MNLKNVRANIDRNEELPHGKVVENNLISSFELAGIPVQRGAELDHNSKIDCLVLLNGERCGIQISLQLDMVKARAAKCCALDVVQRFIYLRVSDRMFDRPDLRAGQRLHELLTWATARQPQYPALLIAPGEGPRRGIVEPL
ncbi:MAG: hypothetical protein A2511_09080 [Deltaproteobacteria bacterium RIFOXYD12_FULL_50_9]|nr:MAG: hypothetical protein A2511_09080 [Deltaproteobacteria bacterium RIFOXYD12_FULL_50_9]